eukprot:TRINITY_DN11738_c0_g1_i2.p1 TRINITY_DN11738_c0_g1~~TRINITY_DN11738_c0_g1_i2.p1  ORF type:complete len:243 (-),score=55.95 TRINITY_DN11738_c0_g1_i2:94-822(-)
MGGHGGLNILPQKRWNVYNRDNREKVEKDKAKAEKQRQEKEKIEQESLADMRYEILRNRKRRRNREENSPEPASKSNVTKELEEMTKDRESCHVNLFEEEEKQLQAKKKLDRILDFDQQNRAANEKESVGSSFFLGAVKKQVPWYLSSKKEDLRSNPTIDTRRPKDSFYSIIGGSQGSDTIKKKEKERSNSRSRSRSRSLERKITKNGNSKIEELRRERLEREAAERKRAEELRKRMGSKFS